MNRFSLHEFALEPQLLQSALRDPACGGYVSFEGAVRDHNEGRTVRRLEYEAFAALALREGERILTEACERFGLERGLELARVEEVIFDRVAGTDDASPFQPRNGGNQRRLNVLRQ